MKMRHIGNLYWHSHRQDLKREEGRAWFNQRGATWFYWGHPDKSTPHRGPVEFHWQFVLGSSHRSGHLNFTAGNGDGNDGVMFDIGAFGCNLYVGFEGVLPDRWQPRVPGRKYPEAHTLGVRIFDGSIWWDLWAVDGEWDSRRNWRDPRSCVRQPVWHVVDRLLGKTRHSETPGTTHEATYIDTDGQAYPVTIRLYESTWKRPRWPRVRRVMRARIDMHRPIPVPASEGIYELTGDPDDAIYSLTTTAATVDEALSALARSVARDRGRD